MPYEVKMPQLGMNQDSAVIVAWLKAAGDKVAKGDPIFEVETDKATMEVEATTDGYLAGIVAGEGDDVPVGDLIALLVDSEAEVADHAGTEPKPVAEPTPEPPATPEEAAPEPEPDPVAPPPPAPGTDKVLASPLAKRLAGEQGIDLGALRAGGIAEPIHASDLSTAQAGGQSHLAAAIDSSALDALLERSDDADRTALFAAFVAGGWRAVFGSDDFAVSVLALDGTQTILPNLERGGADSSEAPELRLIDLCDTRLGLYAPASGGIALTVARDGPSFALTLSFNEGTLPLSHAIALLDAIAARVENPIRQLL